MAHVQVILGVLLLVLAMSTNVAAEVLLTRANPGVRLPLWGKPSEPPRTPSAARVLSGLCMVSALLGVASLSAARVSDDIVWWWGAVLVGVVVSVPGVLTRVFVRFLRRLPSRRQPVQQRH
jgi:hypothetical protein